MTLTLRLLLAVLGLWTIAPAHAGDLTPICPDRPGKGTSPCTLVTGHFEADLGLFDESFQRRSGVTTDTGNESALMLKYGVSERSDVEASMALNEFERIHDAGGMMNASDVGDLYLRLKYNALGEGAFVLVLDPYFKVPMARRLGNGAVESGLVAATAYDVGNNWSLSMSPEADLLLNASGSGYHANLVNVVGLSHALGLVTLGAEIWTAQNLDPAGGVSQYSLDLAAAWLTDDNSQLDLGVNFGLNHPTPDLEVYSGVSLRF